ncbi:MAG TPA: hypothetical protein ENN75_01445 [candidate division Zixibacteria bacterium]|nr:hypothetical protein [candidate division Zixibacteria bacterium]
MKTKAICLIGIMMLASISLIGQVFPTVTIDQSCIPDATSKSNGFKIVSPGEPYPNMELFAVYMFDSTTIKIAQSTDGGMTWDTISIMNPGLG